MRVHPPKLQALATASPDSPTQSKTKTKTTCPLPPVPPPPQPTPPRTHPPAASVIRCAGRYGPRPSHAHARAPPPAHPTPHAPTCSLSSSLCRAIRSTSFTRTHVACSTPRSPPEPEGRGGAAAAGPVVGPLVAAMLRARHTSSAPARCQVACLAGPGGEGGGTQGSGCLAGPGGGREAQGSGCRAQGSGLRV